MSIVNEIQRLQIAKADIKAAIENKGVTVGDGTIDTYAEKIGEISGSGSGDYNQGYEDGKNSVVQLDRYLKTATFTSLNMFGTSEAVLNLDSATSLAQLFSITYKTEEDLKLINTTVEHLTINSESNIISMQQAFYVTDTVADNKLKHLTLNFDKSAIARYENAFYGLRALEIIDGSPLNFSVMANASANMFRSCLALKELRVVPNTINKNFNIAYSNLLSTDTIQSIIDGLADLTNSDTQTLTLHADVGAKLTDEQKATITAKNWTLAY